MNISQLWRLRLRSDYTVLNITKVLNKKVTNKFSMLYCYLGMEARAKHNLQHKLIDVASTFYSDKQFMRLLF